MSLKASIIAQVLSLRSSTNRSLAEFEKAFIRHGSGRYFSLLPDPKSDRRSVRRKPATRTVKPAARRAKQAAPPRSRSAKSGT